MSETRHLVRCAFEAHAGCERYKYVFDTEALPGGWDAIQNYPCCPPCQEYVGDDDYQQWLEPDAHPLGGIELNILAAQKGRQEAWIADLKASGPPPTTFELLERRVSALEQQVALLAPPTTPDAGGETG